MTQIRSANRNKWWQVEDIRAHHRELTIAISGVNEDHRSSMQIDGPNCITVSLLTNTKERLQWPGVCVIFDCDQSHRNIMSAHYNGVGPIYIWLATTGLDGVIDDILYILKSRKRQFPLYFTFPPNEWITKEMCPM